VVARGKQEGDATELFHSNRQGGWRVTGFTYSTFRQRPNFCVTPSKISTILQKFCALGGEGKEENTCDGLEVRQKPSWRVTSTNIRHRQRGPWCVTVDLNEIIQYFGAQKIYIIHHPTLGTFSFYNLVYKVETVSFSCLFAPGRKQFIKCFYKVTRFEKVVILIGDFQWLYLNKVGGRKVSILVALHPQNCFHCTYLVRRMCSKYSEYSEHPNWLMRLWTSCQQHLHGPRRTWWPRWPLEMQLWDVKFEGATAQITSTLRSKVIVLFIDRIQVLSWRNFISAFWQC
jgi:hypothetical protein